MLHKHTPHNAHSKSPYLGKQDIDHRFSGLVFGIPLASTVTRGTEHVNVDQSAAETTITATTTESQMSAQTRPTKHTIVRQY